MAAAPGADMTTLPDEVPKETNPAAPAMSEDPVVMDKTPVPDRKYKDAPPKDAVPAEAKAKEDPPYMEAMPGVDICSAAVAPAAVKANELPP